jgi:hypothetical protein
VCGAHITVAVIISDVCFVCTQSVAASFLLEADPTAAVSKHKAKFDTLHLRVANTTLHAELDPDSTDVFMCKASVCAHCTLILLVVIVVLSVSVKVCIGCYLTS